MFDDNIYIYIFSSVSFFQIRFTYGSIHRPLLPFQTYTWNIVLRRSLSTLFLEIWPSLLKSSTRDLLFILLSCLRFRRSFLRIFSLDFLLSPPTKNIYIYIYFIILESSRAVAAFFLNPLLPFTISMAVFPRGIIPRDTDPWILTDWSFYMERRGREGRDRFHLRWTCLFLARFLPDHLLFYLDTDSIYSPPVETGEFIEFRSREET